MRALLHRRRHCADRKSMNPIYKPYDSIIAVEQSLDVEALTYRDVHVWPLLRSKIYHSLKESNPDDYANFPARARALQYETRLETQPGAVWGESGIARRCHTLQKTMPSQSGPDLLLLSRDWEHGEGCDGRAFNRYVDPYLAVLDEDFQVLKLELAENTAATEQDRWWPTTYFPKPNLAPYFTWARQNPARVKGLDHLNSVASQFGVETPSEATIINDMEQVFGIAEHFKPILGHFKPKMVGTTCYYCEFGYGLMKACRDLGVPSLDIQHGGNWDLHCDYMHFSKVPTDGYALLPDMFWMWSDHFRRKTECALPPETPHHRTVTGGNMDLALSFEMANAERTEERSQFLEERKNWTRNILVAPSILFGRETSLELAFRTMAKAPGDWFWMIRAHPLDHSDEEVAGWERQLRDHGLTNFDTRMCRDMPLGLLLPVCDHVVTSWSGISFDALALGIPSSLTHPLAAAAVPDGIRGGFFVMAEDPDSLINNITTSVRGNVDCGEAAPILDPAAAKKAMSVLLGREVSG